MITLGPYTFTKSDALRTMANLGGLWSGMAECRTSDAAEQIGAALAQRLRAALQAPVDADLGALGVLASSTLGDSPLLAEVLADVWETLPRAAEAFRADGQMPATAIGSVTQLSSSKGGVPKLAVPSVVVDFTGVVGDVQRVRIHHGRPWQALCLFADEVIATLRAEGHPINPGSTGENITVSGLDWTQVRPGVRIDIGSVQALVQAYAEPCATNAQFFVDGNFNAMNKSRGAFSRVYATVLQPGTITTGDPVTLEP